MRHIVLCLLLIGCGDVSVTDTSEAARVRAAACVAGTTFCQGGTLMLCGSGALYDCATAGVLEGDDSATNPTVCRNNAAPDADIVTAKPNPGPAGCQHQFPVLRVSSTVGMTAFNGFVKHSHTSESYSGPSATIPALMQSNVWHFDSPDQYSVLVKDVDSSGAGNYFWMWLDSTGLTDGVQATWETLPDAYMQWNGCDQWTGTILYNAPPVWSARLRLTCATNASNVVHATISGRL